MPRAVRLAALITIAATFACQDRRSSTSLTIRPLPTTPTVPDPVRVRIEGPTSIPPGQTAQFRLVTTFSDGSSQDLTSKAAWYSMSPTVIKIESGGVATALARGAAELVASYGSSARTAVMVLEDGTFPVTARVLEGTLPIVAAQVVVTRGVGKGLAAMSDERGIFVIYGVAGDIELEASHDGYNSARQSLSVARPAQAPDFVLQPLANPADVSGDWRMTLTPSPSCGTLPGDLTSRSYNVNVSQTGGAASVRIAADSLPKPVVVDGRVLNRTLTFALSAVQDYYYRLNPVYDLLDVLDASRFLGIRGSVTVTASGAALQGALVGNLAVYVGAGIYLTSKLQSECSAPDHRVVLQR